MLIEQLKRNPHLSYQERSSIERELAKLAPRETADERSVREFHETHLPTPEILISTSILAAPDSLRQTLAPDAFRISEIREQIYKFHLGIERLRGSGWDAQHALADAAKASKETKAAEVSAGLGWLRPRSRFDRQRSKLPPPLPSEVKNLMPSDASNQWQWYAHRVLSGQKPSVSLAYVDFLYAAALSGAGELGTLAKLKVASGQEQTSSEAAALRELTRALINDARIRTSKSVLQDLSELARRVDSPSAHRFAAALPADTVQVALARAGKEIAALQEIPEWDRTANLLNLIEGFSATENVLDLYLRDGESRHLVRVERESGRTSLLLSEQANAAFRDHCRAQIRKYSRPGFRLANVLRVKGGYRILMAERSIRLTNAEVAHLDRGERLPPEHALSRALARDPSFVVYSHPLMMREGRYNSEADHLAFSIQRSYREARVFKDDLSDRTESRARAVSNYVIDSAADVIVLKAADSFRVDDANIINDIVDDLSRSGIKVEELSQSSAATSERSRLVIVISGHIDENLAAFVRRAGEAGYFRNNIVAFNSCASELTSQLAHEMNTRYGAIATYRYEGKIPAVKVQEILMKLNDEIERRPSLEDWKRFVLEEGLTGVWNICTLEQREQYVG